MKAFAPLIFGGAILALAIYSGFADLAGCVFLCLLALSVVLMPGKLIGKTLGTLFVAALLNAFLNPQINTTLVTNQADSVIPADLTAIPDFSFTDGQVTPNQTPVAGATTETVDVDLSAQPITNP